MPHMSLKLEAYSHLSKELLHIWIWNRIVGIANRQQTDFQDEHVSTIAIGYICMLCRFVCLTQEWRLSCPCNWLSTTAQRFLYGCEWSASRSVFAIPETRYISDRGMDEPRINLCVRNTVVGIATRYGLDGPGIESRWGLDFLHPSRPALITHPI
jgi:hypothetical protein